MFSLHLDQPVLLIPKGFTVQPVLLFALIALLNLVMLGLAWMVAGFQQRAAAK